MCFFSLMTRLAVISLGLFFMRGLHAEPKCDDPVYSYLTGNPVPSVVKFDGNVRSLPFGADLRFIMPSSLVSKSGTKIFACIRWESEANLDTAAIDKYSGELDQKTKATVQATKIAKEKLADFVKSQKSKPAQSLTNAFELAHTAALVAADAAKGPDSLSKAMEVLNKTSDTAAKVEKVSEIFKSIVQNPASPDELALEKAVNDAVGAANASRHNAEFIKGRFDVWTKDLPLRVLESKSDISIINLVLPTNIHDRIDGSNPYRWWWPTKAELRFIVSENNQPVFDTVLPIRISSYPFAASAAIIITIIFWLGFYQISKLLGCKGDWFLSVISNKHGSASLSQFQIMLWTMLIAGSITYVMVLSGQLIDIKTTTLYLLGISGFSVVLSKIQRTGESSTAEQKSIQAPGAVTDLSICGNPGDTQLVLTWKPPKQGVTPTAYKVNYKETAGGNWSQNPSEVAESCFVVTNLSPDTAYDFRVTTTNSGVDGVNTDLLNKKTAPSAAAAQAPDTVTGLTLTQNRTSINQLGIKWAPLVNATDCYLVKYRPQGLQTWLIDGVVAGDRSEYILTKLLPNTSYEIQVLGVKNGKLGPESLPVIGKTAIRVPRWSDLLEADGGGEIDVSRIQMLYFTLIAAIFVLLKVGSANEIPDIPDGLLLLMGISNGVYLTAKFIPK